MAPHRPRRLLWTALITALTLVVLLAAGAVGLWRLTWMAPAWWSPVETDDETTAALAERVEYRLAEEAHKVRPEPKPWWIKIRQDQINAWLASRLPEWVAHEQGLQWPAQVGQPQVHLESGAVTLGVDIDTNAGTRYVAARVVPRIIDGELALALDGISVGRVWIPGSSVGAVVDRMRAVGVAGMEGSDQFLDDPGIEALITLLDGGRQFDPTLALNDGRRVRVLDVRCDSGALLLRAETIAQK
ncbi:MAG: hypothetical protein ACYSU7_12190 [Planctomycetota bacterium]|jgi:hypothetical protein